MQKTNLKRQRPKKLDATYLDSGTVASEPLDAWGWAERISVIGLFTLAVGYALFAMQGIFVPVVTAWVMGAVLRPVVGWAEKIGVPRIVSVIATAVIALLLLLAIVRLLSTPFAYWIGRTEELAALIKEKLQLLTQPLALKDALIPPLLWIFVTTVGGQFITPTIIGHPPHPESFSRVFVDCILGLDVGPVGRIAGRAAAHLRRCRAATSFGVPAGSVFVC